MAKEFIKLALRSEDYYKHILAVTFTNRAAEEMKERVLEFLIHLSRGKHELLPVLAVELQVSEEETQRRASAALTHMLHHYGLFGIMTIDTFFHKVIRSFSREIGLQGSFGIELDNDKVAEFLATDVYRGAEDNELLRKWLMDFSMAQLQEGKSYEHRGSVGALAKELFKDAVKQLKGGDFLKSDLKEKIRGLQQQLDAERFGFERHLHKIGEQFFRIIGEKQLTIDDFFYGKAGVANFFHKLRENSLDDLQVGARVSAALESSSAWVKKGHDRYGEILNLVESQLHALLSEAVDFMEKKGVDYRTASAARRNLYTLGLLNDLALRLQEYKQDKEIIMISDLPDFLNKIIDDSGSPFIYEKVGSRYHHFLIDEFQDTSRLQWDNFRPLLEESMSSGHENIIVGDVKQSIYSWRGGDPTLLLEGVEADFKGRGTKTENIATNWRSARNVVAFNNALFTALPDLLTELMADVLGPEDLARFKTAYADVQQQVAPRNQAVEGLVQVEFLEPEENNKESKRDAALVRMLEVVEQLLAEGHRLNDMAMLVRTNKDAAAIVNFVLEYKRNNATQVEVISAEGMLLTSARVVQLLLAAFRHLLNPVDSQVKGNLIFFWRQLCGLSLDGHADFKILGQDKDVLPEKFVKHKEHLLHLPILELTEVIIRMFELNAYKEEFTYLQAFQDAVLEYSKNNRSDLRLFLEWWDEVAAKRSVQLTGALDAIEIITSHKSKGLQYPIVFIPFCDFSMDGLDSSTHWFATEGIAQLKPLDYVPLDYSSKLDDTHFRAPYRQQKQGYYLESLNVLYVALTRAENGLFVFCPKPKEKQRGEDKAYTSPDKLLWAYFQKFPNENWKEPVFRWGSLPKKHREREGDLMSLQAYTSNKWSHKLTVRTTGRAYYDDLREKQRAEGVLLHQILAEIHHWEQADEVLDRYERRMEITVADKENFRQVFDRLWQDPQVKSWFDGTGTVKTEVVVLPAQGETKRMDRVVLRGEEALVIDFKSGHPKTADDRQVKEYLGLLQEMGYRSTGYLLYLKTGEVREI